MLRDDAHTHAQTHTHRWSHMVRSWLLVRDPDVADKLTPLCEWKCALGGAGGVVRTKRKKERKYGGREGAQVTDGVSHSGSDGRGDNDQALTVTSQACTNLQM